MSRQPGKPPGRGGRETLGRLGGLSASEADRGERALWLSGDGHRAALFHLGALTRLNEVGLLAQIGTVGAVAGGSIVAALLATRVPWPLHGAYRDWPEQVAEPLREIASRNSRARAILRRPLAQTGPGAAAREEQYARELVKSRGGEPAWGPRFVFGASGLTLSGLAAGWEECLEWEIGASSGEGGYPPDLVAETIAAVRTDLDAFGEAERAVLENHGYLLADAALRERGMSGGGVELAPPEPPHPGWMAPQRVREALASSGRRTLVGRLWPRRAGRVRRVPEGASEELSELLRRHRPVLQYDSVESCRADSVATICDVVAADRSNSLHRADGSVIAAARPSGGEAELALEFLGGPRYANGEPARAGDYLDECGGAHAEDALAIRSRDPAAYADVVYGRARHDPGGAVWLQYWFFYYLDDRGLLGLERHEGDWEMVQLRLGGNGSPEAATFARHGGGERLRWDQVELALTEDGQVPVVYPARGSHASLARPGSYPAPVVADHNDGLGPRVRPRLETIADDGPGWVLWPGRWGSTRRREHFEADSPRGPRRQPQWWDPAAFHDEAAPWSGEPLAGALEGAPTQPQLEARVEGGLALVSFGFPTGGAAAARLVAAPFDATGATGGSQAFAVESPAGEVALQLSGGREWRGVRVAATSVQGVPGETASATFR